MGLLKRVENDLVRPLVRWVRPSRRINLGGIDIRYRSELDGGGTDFRQDFIPFLKSRGMPKQKRAFEWCCGPAFIGFSMLGNGLCETLCLSDINPAAVASCRNTVASENFLPNSEIACFCCSFRSLFILNNYIFVAKIFCG